MTVHNVAVSVSGKSVLVPSVTIDDSVVVVNGRFPRIANVHDDDWTEMPFGGDPALFVERVKASALGADVFTFAQAIWDSTPKYPFPYEWDNVAAADTRNFSAWWEKLPQSTRKNSRRSDRRGAQTQLVSLDEKLARGIKAIYDERAIRQGRRFWHYGKDVDTVWRENSSYLDRSDFIGTYYQDELIGFLKIVYVGQVAKIMQIIARASHYDKRPMNALIAKAVELCSQKGMAHLVYSKFQYGNNTNTQLMEFKVRNGFDRRDFPRYFIPLTNRGRLAIACRLHRGWSGMMPPRIIKQALKLRESANKALTMFRSGVAGTPRAERAESAGD